MKNGPSECVSCGRAAGHLRSGAMVCSVCVNEVTPSPLSTWRAAVEISIDDLAAACGVSDRSIKFALAGVPVGPRVATRISKVTGIAVEALILGTGGN